MTTATVINLRTGDMDEAVEIGKLYAKAKKASVDQLKDLIEAGHRLKKMKKELKVGSWMPWLKENADKLGFGQGTANKLMAAAKDTFVASYECGDAEAARIIRTIWGHSTKPKEPKAKKTRERTAKKEAKAREIVRPMVAAGVKIDYSELEKQHDISHGTFDKAVAIEKALLNETTDIDALPKTAKDKLEIAKRMIERKLASEYATRMHNLEEEVRQRVLKESEEHKKMLDEEREKARKTESLFREMTHSKRIFTSDQFRTVLMCLHPDGERTAGKLSEAFRLFNGKKLQLIGEK